LAYAASTAADLAEREERLAHDREDISGAFADAERRVSDAEGALSAVIAATSGERSRLQAAERALAGIRDRVRVAQEVARVTERDDVGARIAAESLREQLLVELAVLGATAIGPLLPGDAAADTDLEPEALERALDVAAAGWEASLPTTEPPSPTRLA